MFRKYIQSLSNEELNEFLHATEMSEATLRNAYMPVDPLKRRVPSTDRIVAIIIACKGNLHALTILDYFIFQSVFEHLKESDDHSIHLKGSGILGLE